MQLVIVRLKDDTEAKRDFLVAYEREGYWFVYDDSGKEVIIRRLKKEKCEIISHPGYLSSVHSTYKAL